jgi:hypothetical protein
MVKTIFREKKLEERIFGCSKEKNGKEIEENQS